MQKKTLTQLNKIILVNGENKMSANVAKKITYNNSSEIEENDKYKILEEKCDEILKIIKDRKNKK